MFPSRVRRRVVSFSVILLFCLSSGAFSRFFSVLTGFMLIFDDVSWFMFHFDVESGGERGLSEGQAESAPRIPGGDERAHLPPLGQVLATQEGLDEGKSWIDRWID